ncbi:MAG TPA: hypothetical protein VKS01_11765 [Bryobacteraceae bacterium]|nr:hypothetical protein [Bryobacteraceae bacterium]
MALTVGVHFSPAPVAPFAIILLVGETLIGLELENHRVPRLLHEIFRAPKHHAYS